MSSDIGDVIDAITQPPPDTTTTTPPPDAAAATTTTDNADIIAGLQAKVNSYEQQLATAKPILDALNEDPSIIHDIRARQVQRNAPPQQQDPNAVADRYNQAFNYEQPGVSAAKIAADVANTVMAPAQQQINGKLAQFAIQNFKAQKVNSPFFAAVAPLFDRQIAKIDKAQLGALDETWINNTLETAWNASLGEYVSTEQAKRPKPAPPVNLGGGGSGGGGGASGKTLAEIDPVAYRWAVNAGLTEEQMAEIAKESEG
jgi:hypothetical protein